MGPSLATQNGTPDDTSRNEDPVEKATETVKKHAPGAFCEEKRGILQATGFVGRPEGTIAVAQYSSGPIGRLVWQNVLGLVQFYRTQAK